MSTVTTAATPAAPAGSATAVDPTAAVARTRPRNTLAETVSQTMIMAWRALKKMRRNPHLSITKT